MTNSPVYPSDGARPGGPFAPAVVASGSTLLAVSGQIAQDASGSLVGGVDPGEQARQCLRNLDAILNAAGASRTDVIRVTVFLTDMRDRGAVADARLEYFGDHRPAATLVEVSALVYPEYRVEIEATAVF